MVYSTLHSIRSIIIQDRAYERAAPFFRNTRPFVTRWRNRRDLRLLSHILLILYLCIYDILYIVLYLYIYIYIYIYVCTI